MTSAVATVAKPLREPGHVDRDPRDGSHEEDGEEQGHDQASSAVGPRAISVPLTPVRKGLSRSLAATPHRRSGQTQARTVPIPKLTVPVRFPSPAPGPAGQLRHLTSGTLSALGPGSLLDSGAVLWSRGEFCKEIQRGFLVESGERPEGAGQVAEVVAGWGLAVQVAEPFSSAEAVELGGDDRGGVLVGGPGEL